MKFPGSSGQVAGMAHNDLSCFAVAVDAEPNLFADGVAAESGLQFPWRAHRFVVD